jgi:hypothetical protein
MAARDVGGMGIIIEIASSNAGVITKRVNGIIKVVKIAVINIVLLLGKGYTCITIVKINPIEISAGRVEICSIDAIDEPHIV